MFIQSEPAEKNSIESYDENSIVISAETYARPVFICAEKIIDLPLETKLATIDFSFLAKLEPKIMQLINVLLIGHSTILTPTQFMSFNEKGIGLESMQRGAACRTFNLLLSEYRKVGLILL
ncbi:MAG: hypothetical protein A3F18_08435 [Legionellales bacterium RIFCSPHIGHO2_12_FULL_37_14]|nr:MAG: hypothetical protein A3F18_08435 [Legionellales bacterium RIFCSPHIGHO2_12_FULL_37_14]